MSAVNLNNADIVVGLFLDEAKREESDMVIMQIPARYGIPTSQMVTDDDSDGDYSSSTLSRSHSS